MTLQAMERIRTAWIASANAAILDRIHEEGVHLALWQRRRSPGFDWLNTVDLDEIDDIEASLPVETLSATIPGELERAGYPKGDDTSVLALEVVALARRFARIMESEEVRLRLEIVETDACRKFHMDNVKARLLMPLTDPGTQWIETAAGENPPIQQLRAGDVGLFKGRVWADEPAILHRSPPIAGTGKSRVLLVLDLPQSAPHGSPVS